MPDPNGEKSAAASEALKLVKNGMVLGLGTGTTFEVFLDLLSEKVKQGLKISGVPSSERTAVRARERGITILAEPREIDLTVDGADEFDDHLFLIKGGGGALMREKVAAANSRHVCIIVDSSKYNGSGIGRFPVPVEISKFLSRHTMKKIEKLGCRCTLRDDGRFLTDNGNQIADCKFDSVPDPVRLESQIKSIPGVLEVGLFTSINWEVIMGTKSGVKTFRK